MPELARVRSGEAKVKAGGVQKGSGMLVHRRFSVKVKEDKG